MSFCCSEICSNYKKKPIILIHRCTVFLWFCEFFLVQPYFISLLYEPESIIVFVLYFCTPIKLYEYYFLYSLPFDTFPCLIQLYILTFTIQTMQILMRVSRTTEPRGSNGSRNQSKRKGGMAPINGICYTFNIVERTGPPKFGSKAHQNTFTI